MNIEQYRALKAQEEAEAIQKTEQTQAAETKTKTTDENLDKEKKEQIPENKTTPKDNDTTSEKKESEKIIIDGIGEVTLEELKNGYMRQKDYTKKTQEVSRKDKELKEAATLFNYLKQNPQAAQKMFPDGKLPPPLDPHLVKMHELENKVYDMMLEKEIETLQNKYEDFEVKEVLEMAQEKQITNLEDAYHLVKSRKPAQTVDKETLKKELREELLKELMEEKKATSSIISTNDSQTVEEKMTPQLTEKEKKVAKGLKMTDEDYIKWRDIGKKK